MSAGASLDDIKQRFRSGDRAGAIAACQAACDADPGDAGARRLLALMLGMTGDLAGSLQAWSAVRELAPQDVDALFNLAICERDLGRPAKARDLFAECTRRAPKQADGWVGLAETAFATGAFQQAFDAAQRALVLQPKSALAWMLRGRCELAGGQPRDAVASLGSALALDGGLVDAFVARADALRLLGDDERALADYRAALRLHPAHDEAVKKASVCLSSQGRVDEGIDLCREALAARPESLTARLGLDWLLSQLVPLWHVPMMNERERNQAYLDGIVAAVKPGDTVFEVGTGSGLLAMMAARAGAGRVVTCEAVPLVARTAQQIVAANGFAERVTVVPKPSYGVTVGEELAAPADVLVHEIFSSELLGEHVLPAIEDAKRRLLKPGGRIVPPRASILVALLGGEDLGRELHVGESFGFDLSAFNAIVPGKRPIHREDLPRVLLSEPVAAFDFDFEASDTFPPESRQLVMPVARDGRCFGIIQWIRLDFGGGNTFENHPGYARPVASWQNTVYRFPMPREVQAGTQVTLRAMHDRERPWFELVA